MRLSRSVLQAVFPSPEMAAYLVRRSLRQDRVRDLIAYAPIPLARKRDLFLRTAVGQRTSYFSRQAAVVQRALDALRTKEGEFFYLKAFCAPDEPDQPEERALEPFLSWEHLRERVRSYLSDREPRERELTWFEAERWTPDGTGRLKNDYTFTLFGDEACYFTDNAAPVLRQEWFATDRDLNVPVPFCAGDIVTVDCRPYAPVSHAVILQVGDNWDCCCLQALFRNSDGTWDMDAVKHGCVVPDRRSAWLSPLYRMTVFRGELPEAERTLERVSRWMNADEARGTALWDRIFANEQRGAKTTEAQLLFFIS